MNNQQAFLHSYFIYIYIFIFPSLHILNRKQALENLATAHMRLCGKLSEFVFGFLSHQTASSAGPSFLRDKNRKVAATNSWLAQFSTQLEGYFSL